MAVQDLQTKAHVRQTEILVSVFTISPPGGCCSWPVGSFQVKESLGLSFAGVKLEPAWVTAVMPHQSCPSACSFIRELSPSQSAAGNQNTGGRGILSFLL